MSPLFRFRNLHRETLLFGVALLALYAGIMLAKFTLWRANVLFDDWAFYNTSFWNTNFRDLWMFDHDRYVKFGYPSYLNEHFGPALLALAALYNVVPAPEAMLLLVHGATPIVAAMFIYATGLHLLDDRRLSLTLALSYALCPGILWPTVSMVYGFQTDSLLAPCAAAVGWALATNRIGVYFVAFALALGLKENVPAYGVILGVCLLLFTKRRAQALVTIFLSIAVFVIASKGVPAITGVENRNVGTAWKFIDALIHLRATFDYRPIEIAIGIAYSLAFLPAMFVWPFLGVIVPDLLLIGQVPQANLVSWHIMLPVTVLGSASVFGAARMLTSKVRPAWLDRRMARPRLLRLFSAAVLAVSLIAGPLTIWLAYDRYIVLRTDVDRHAVTRAQALIPPDAGVATTSDVEQYFTHRRLVTADPFILRKAAGEFSYFVVNRRVLTGPRQQGLNMSLVSARDRCMIDAAESLARVGGKMLVDSGGLLAVQFAQLPAMNCD